MTSPPPPLTLSLSDILHSDPMSPEPDRIGIGDLDDGLGGGEGDEDAEGERDGEDDERLVERRLPTSDDVDYLKKVAHDTPDNKLKDIINSLLVSDTLQSAASESTLQDQVHSQASIIGFLRSQITYLATRTTQQFEIWEAEREAWRRAAEVLVKRTMMDVSMGAGSRSREILVEQRCNALMSENVVLRQKLQDSYTRFSSLESELAQLKPLLLMQPYALMHSHPVPRQSVYPPLIPPKTKPMPTPVPLPEEHERGREDLESEDEVTQISRKEPTASTSGPTVRTTTPPLAQQASTSTQPEASSSTAPATSDSLLPQGEAIDVDATTPPPAPRLELETDTEQPPLSIPQPETPKTPPAQTAAQKYYRHRSPITMASPLQPQPQPPGKTSVFWFPETPGRFAPGSPRKNFPNASGEPPRPAKGPMSADAKTEHLLLAARKLGRERATILSQSSFAFKPMMKREENNPMAMSMGMGGPMFSPIFAPGSSVLGMRGSPLGQIPRGRPVNVSQIPNMNLKYYPGLAKAPMRPGPPLPAKDAPMTRKRKDAPPASPSKKTPGSLNTTPSGLQSLLTVANQMLSSPTTPTHARRGGAVGAGAAKRRKLLPHPPSAQDDDEPEWEAMDTDDVMESPSAARRSAKGKERAIPSALDVLADQALVGSQSSAEEGDVDELVDDEDGDDDDDDGRGSREKEREATEEAGDDSRRTSPSIADSAHTGHSSLAPPITLSSEKKGGASGSNGFLLRPSATMPILASNAGSTVGIMPYGAGLTGSKSAPALGSGDKGSFIHHEPNTGKRVRSPYTKWTEEEDVLLEMAVAKHGQKWDQVQKELPNRGYHQVRQRWLRKQGAFDQRVEVAGHIPPHHAPHPLAANAYIETNPRRMGRRIAGGSSLTRNQTRILEEEEEDEHESEEEVDISPPRHTHALRTTTTDRSQQPEAGTSS